jgi:co-chaperonin GroES (HSP10)
MQAIGNKVIVTRLEGNKTTDSGIILKSSQEPDRAKVDSVGPDVTQVSVGDTVLLDWNKAYRIDNDVYGVIEEDVVLVFE